jgi:agmatinase
VSYGKGTQEGPNSLLEASRFMELYDEEIGKETARIGIHTLPPVNTDLEPDAMMDHLQAESAELLRTGKFLCSLGGEHSISAPLVRAHHAKFPGLSVLQIDAHADLRDSYEGSRCSHAAAMRRVLEVCPAVQVGIRSMSLEEAEAVEDLPTKIFFAKDIVGQQGWIERVVEALSGEVYLTIDIDGLDPSVIPFTGTPEPGGLGWYEVLRLIREVASKKRIVGMDLVELCHSETTSAPSFLAAKLIYKTIGYVFESEIPGPSIKLRSGTD